MGKPGVVTPWAEWETAMMLEMAGKFANSRIASALNVERTKRCLTETRSRNAVIGKLNRLGVRLGRPQVKVAALGPKAPASDALRQRALAMKAAAAEVRKEPVASRPPPPPADTPPVVAKAHGWPKPMKATAVLFLDVPRYGRCRMPLWGDEDPIESRFYCGAETIGTATYCADCRPLTVRRDYVRAA